VGHGRGPRVVLAAFRWLYDRPSNLLRSLPGMSMKPRWNGPAPSVDVVRAIYRKRARRYDASTLLYRLLGYDYDFYRRRGVEALRLSPGSTVVEIGCGTGANLERLVSAVGPSGRVIGVDLTDAMLDRARRRAAGRGWENVEIVQSDAASYRFPPQLDAVLSTFALALMPEHEAVVRNASQALRAGGRLVVVDFKAPERWPRWLLAAGVLLLSPYAATMGQLDHRPWEAMARALCMLSMDEHFFGSTYVAVGERFEG